MSYQKLSYNTQESHLRKSSSFVKGGVKCHVCDLIYEEDQIEAHINSHISPHFLTPHTHPNKARKMSTPKLDLDKENQYIQGGALNSMKRQSLPKHEQVRYMKEMPQQKSFVKGGTVNRFYDKEGQQKSKVRADQICREMELQIERDDDDQQFEAEAIHEKIEFDQKDEEMNLAMGAIFQNVENLQETPTYSKVKQYKNFSRVEGARQNKKYQKQIKEEQTDYEEQNQKDMNFASTGQTGYSYMIEPKKSKKNPAGNWLCGGGSVEQKPVEMVQIPLSKIRAPEVQRGLSHISTREGGFVKTRVDSALKEPPTLKKNSSMSSFLSTIFSCVQNNQTTVKHEIEVPLDQADNVLRRSQSNSGFFSNYNSTFSNSYGFDKNRGNVRTKFQQTHGDKMSAFSPTSYRCYDCGGFYCQTCKSTIPPQYRPPGLVRGGKAHRRNEDIYPQEDEIRQYYEKKVYRGGVPAAVVNEKFEMCKDCD